MYGIALANRSMICTWAEMRSVRLSISACIACGASVRTAGAIVAVGSVIVLVLVLVLVLVGDEDEDDGADDAENENELF